MYKASDRERLFQSLHAGHFTSLHTGHFCMLGIFHAFEESDDFFQN